MDKYESIEIVGEGSYGVVMKCRHRETGQVVAIKKFLETEEDIQVRKIAFREIRTLKKLHHENLVNMIEVFRRRKRFYLVFEYLDHTLLDELERAGGGLGWEVSKRHIFQVLRGLNFCHNNHIMHRDVKPENILVSPNGVIKLCDFGFARLVTGANESCTDYVATRWYRAPELLVGDAKYGRAIDVWAAGCLYAEMINGDPLFPGDSDVDQLHRITKVLGGICGKHQTIISRNKNGRLLRHASADGLSRSPKSAVTSLHELFPSWGTVTISFLAQCLRMDPDVRPKCSTLLQHSLFTQDGFAERFLGELQRWIIKESNMNPLISKGVNERRIDILSAASPPRICRSSTGRWQMTLLKDTRTMNDKVESESTAIEETRREERPSALHINRPRELCFFGPVSRFLRRSLQISLIEIPDIVKIQDDLKIKFENPTPRKIVFLVNVI
ncbi:hypothetical protein KM043_011575 [Ampulex compressa]|nr:hypothetical protein KM043_011575 [Ampulex compressa]